ncbi:hypothetical protein SLS62_003147 [Diatrype stigma]|uniref:J domain-containing protein n=1 Tax=Diatrype stigma TaxID=117547 RepID=A0AAN9YQ44_9PEZI
MSSSLLSLAGWTFLPSLVTGWIQSIYYGLTIRAGDPKPAPGSARHAEHRRRIHILVVALYLLYTVYEADYELQRGSTFYADLGVPFGASERDVKSRFRRLAALHHPDKLQQGGASGGAGGDDGGAFFMYLKTATDVLTDPARRFAYERFGPTAVAWHAQAGGGGQGGGCTTIRDYVVRGAQTALVPHYALAAAALYALGLLGYMRVGRYWRWLTLAALCLFELHAVTRPGFPWVVERVLNPALRYVSAGRHAPYLPFQAVSLARRLGITLYIAFNQLGPLLEQQQQQPVGGGRRGGAAAAAAANDDSPEKALEKALDALDQLAHGVDVDAGRLIELEMAPFVGDPAIREVMRPKLKEWMVQNTILNDPMVRDAMMRWRQKRRADAPAGARGTR